MLEGEAVSEQLTRYKATIVVVPHSPGFAEVRSTEDVYRAADVEQVLKELEAKHERCQDCLGLRVKGSAYHCES